MDNNTPSVKTSIDRDTLRQLSKKDKGKRKFDLQYAQENIQPGDNSRFLRHVLAKQNLPPIDISDPKQVEDRINWYYQQCIDDDMRPTVMGLCNSLGINRSTLKRWYDGDTRGPSHCNLIEKAYNNLEEMWENYMLNGKVNPASGIFLGRNHWGYRDTVDVVVRPGQTLADQLPPERIEAQLKDLPDD